MRSSFLVLSLAAVAVLFAGCDKSAPEKKPAAAPPSRSSLLLGKNFTATPEALFDTVWARARRADTLGLVRLMVDDSVFRRNVYPVSPAYDSTRESVFQFVLDMHKANSSKGLKRLLFDVTGADVPVLRLPFADTVKTREGVLFVPLEYNEKTPGVQLFGAILCRAEGCQVVSYAPAGAKGD